MSTFTQCIAASVILACADSVFAHETHAHAPAPVATHSGHAAHATHTATAEQQPWGIAGQATAVTRTITLRMTDDMRFTPKQFTVQLGETVRLRVDNAGQVMHEIVLGTSDSLKAHASAMLQDPGMTHNDAFMAHVPPHNNGELVWTFNRPGTFDFACLISGHYQAGMRGSFTVTP